MAGKILTSRLGGRVKRQMVIEGAGPVACTTSRR
jgi:hypothetical protein